MSDTENVRSFRKVKLGSSRSFGFVFAAAFLVLSLSPLVLRHEPPRWWALALSLAFLAVSLWKPRLLQPLNLLWYRFGLVLHAVINPIVMALLYGLAVLPIGLIMRAMGKDPLRLKREPDAKTYWIPRDPPGPKPGSMSKQF